MKTNFSQHRCRELAATQRLMMEMPECQLTLVTRVATICANDYGGSMRLLDVVDEIMFAREHPLKRGRVPTSTKITGREGRQK